MNNTSLEANRNIQLMISSDLGNLELVRQAIKALASLVLPSDEAIHQIELATIEATTNSIRHAYLGEKGKEISITLYFSPHELTIQVSDTGLSFDAQRLESLDPNAWTIDPNNIDQLPESGMGLLLIKSSMDSVSYRSHNGRNVMTMTKSVNHHE